jgi:ribosomal protein S18 acetylase RimI-like enzyme
MSMTRLTFAPYDSRRDKEVLQLFLEYSHKDFQLKTLGIPKDRMGTYLERTLTEPHSQNICLRDKGRLVGLVALQYLRSMSQHFGLRMYAVRHLLARSDSPMVHTRLLRFVIEELPDVDFLDCRVAVDDIYSAHALEVCGFRYVGTEVFLGRAISSEPCPPLPPGMDIRYCRREDQKQVLEIVSETHVHNRFVYDPIIDEKTAQSLYCKLVMNCFQADPFKVLVTCSPEGVEGFITFKKSTAFSEIVGLPCGSLDLIGVRPQTRNRGLGAVLNQMALGEMAKQGIKIAAVRTLASNYPALKTCLRTGFTVTSTSLHFHRWILRPGISNSASRPASLQKNLRFAERVEEH